MEHDTYKPLHCSAKYGIAIFNLLATVALTGCEGFHDAFNPKAVPVQVTESAQGSESTAASSPAPEMEGTAVPTIEPPRATRTSASGSYRGDTDVDSDRASSDESFPSHAIPSQPAPNQRSGSRIRAKVLVTDDGDRAFLGWYDSQRQQDCDFVPDAEGTLRCLPLGAEGAIGNAAELTQFVAADYALTAGSSRIKGYGLVAQDGAVDISSFYDETTDLGCQWTGDGDAARCVPQAQRISYYVDLAHTRLLIQGAPESPTVTPNIGEHYHPSNCSSDYYRSGEPYPGVQVFQRGSRNARPIAQGETFYELGEPIDGASFASAVVKTDTADTGRLTAMYWTTSDGGTWFSHWYDNELATECTFSQGVDPRCVPKSDGARIYYGDAQCSDRVAEVFPRNDCSSRATPPPYVTLEEVDANGVQRVTAYAVSSERVLTTRYEKTSQGTCQPRVAPERAHYFDLGDPVPGSDLAGGHVVVE